MIIFQAEDVVKEAFRTRTRVRRCDANCYEGKGTRCNCICGGINHGVGLKRAQDQAAEVVDGIELDDGQTIQLRFVY